MSWAFETLIATSLLMGLVLLLRRPVGRAFGAHAAYALWLAPLVRLLLPPMPIRLPAAIEPPNMEFVVVQGGHAVPLISLPQILAAAWALGAGAFLLWHILAYRRFLADALLRGRATATPDINDAAVIATAAVTGPAAAGLLVRRIFVPQDFDTRFTPDEQRMALAHEALHHRRGAFGRVRRRCSSSRYTGSVPSLISRTGNFAAISNRRVTPPCLDVSAARLARLTPGSSCAAQASPRRRPFVPSPQSAN